MINYVTTTLFDSPAQTLVNTVNTVGVMGKGVAAEFRHRYPEMFRRYRELCEERQLDIGKLYLYRTPNKWVLNFPTKKHWRNPSRIEYIEAGLQKFVDTYTVSGITSISFPQLGCGNGNLPWSMVRPVMEKYLRSLPIPVYIHLARRRASFVPEHLNPELLDQSLQAREGVSFNRFWNDLRAVVGMDASPANQSIIEDLQSLVLRAANGEVITLPAEDFEDLWNSLRMRGAMRQDEFPGALLDQRDRVTDLLLRLDYLRPFQFTASDRSGRKRNIPGISFAPPPSGADTPRVALEATT